MPRTDGPGTLRLELDLIHPAREDLQLGAIVDDVYRCFDFTPTGWGVAEPITQRWSLRQLTENARKHAPKASTVVVLGGEPTQPAVGLHTTRRIPAGVQEQLRAAIGVPNGPNLAAINQLAERVAARRARHMTIAWQAGRADGTRAPEPVPIPAPLGLLLGPEHKHPQHSDSTTARQPHLVPPRSHRLNPQRHRRDPRGNKHLTPGVE